LFFGPNFGALASVTQATLALAARGRPTPCAAIFFTTMLDDILDAIAPAVKATSTSTALWINGIRVGNLLRGAEVAAAKHRLLADKTATCPLAHRRVARVRCLPRRIVAINASEGALGAMDRRVPTLVAIFAGVHRRGVTRFVCHDVDNFGLSQLARKGGEPVFTGNVW
jgi:hypothetical protein